jgi:phasin family protein
MNPMAETTPLNPFAAVMTQAKSAADDLTRMFADMKMPAMPSMPDAAALMAAYKRNMDVMSEANKIALEGAQAVAKRHMEIMQTTMVEASESIKALTSMDSPADKAAKQTEMLKKAYELAVANTKELADLIQHANGEALAVLNKRFVEAMDEVNALAAKTKG